ncbi:MAG: sugar-binding transcriptional regulator [Chloroflexota bacterium]|nr:sugar-binding transcriptional regulator [Anaerolineae bacterium]
MSESLKVKISRMYYYKGMTKQDIARRLRISRFRVSRLLEQARDEGIVQIQIVEPPIMSMELEEELEERFGLQRAIVVKTTSDSEEVIKEAIGRATAECLMDVLKDGDVLGIAWGTTVNEAVKALPPKLSVDIRVVQVTGGLNQMAINVNAIDLTRRVAEICDADYYLLHAPAMVSNAAARQALLSDNGIKRTFDMFERVNVALAGIGALSPELVSTYSTYYRAGYIRDADLELLKHNRVVGDIFAHFFDVEGRICDAELEERIIGMSTTQLKNVEYSIGIGGGPHKHQAILGALKGKLINLLVTDHATAKAILASDA